MGFIDQLPLREPSGRGRIHLVLRAARALLGHSSVPAKKLLLVIALHDEHVTLRRERLHMTHDPRRIRPAIDEVPDEHEPVLARPIRDMREQILQLEQAPVHVANGKCASGSAHAGQPSSLAKPTP